MKTILTVIALLMAFSQAGSETVLAAASAQAATKPARFDGTVEIYVTEWCGYCKKAVKYMESNNIRYVAYDVEKDSAAAQRHKELGGRGVPLIVIGKNKMPGFSPEKFEKFMSEAK